VPPEHAESNYRLVREAWLDRTAAPPGGVHRVRGELDPDEAAAAYESELRAVLGTPPRLDLVLLGLGTDGHTASLFPGSEALSEQQRLVVATHGTGPVTRRITLTLPALTLARGVVLLVQGQGKAEIVRRVLEPRSGEPPLPVHAVLERVTSVLWLLDAAAASRLDHAR
jgi:6-phosphogluconolactonase